MHLLERERELARISELVERAGAGKPGFVLVEGPAGAGKSSILGALASSADARGLRVLRAIGLELERDYPFGVVRQLFEPVIHGLDETTRGGLFTGAAALAEPLLVGRGTESRQLDDSGFALIHSLYWLLVGLTDLGPLALVVDDIQWADSPSLRFLAFALKRSEDLPMLLAVARRDLPAAEQSDAVTAATSGPASVMRPAPLSAEAIGSLLASAVGRDLDDEIVTEAERLTGGNPLYVQELSDALRDAGDTVADDPLETLQGAAPAAVGRRVQASLARLDEPTRSVAGAVAILGEEVPLRRAALLSEVEHERASTAVDALVRADILVVGEPLRFRHPLVRQAVLESIEPRARAAMHGRTARLLIADGEPSQLAAIHLLESDPAGDPEMVRMLRSAAEYATGEAAPELAISALRRALREPPDPSQRPLILKELALVEAQVGNPEALGHFEEAFASASSLEEMADGAVRYAMQLMTRARYEEAEALIDRVLAAIGDCERRLMLEAEFCNLAVRFAIPGARARLRRAATGLRGESPAERLLLGLRANEAVNTVEGRSVEAARLVRAALEDGFLLQELGPDSPTYVMFVGVLQSLDEFELADRELAAATIEARRRGAAFGLAMASMLQGVVAWKRGQLRRAEADARTAVEIASQMGWLAGFPLPVANLVEVLNDAGALDDADRLLEQSGLDGQVAPGWATILLLGARGRLRLSQGHAEQGIEDLLGQRAQLDRIGDPPARDLAPRAKSLIPALMQAGRDEQARDIANEALRVSRAFGQPRYIADSLHAHALAEPGGADIDRLWEAASIYEQIGARIELARVLIEVGSQLRRRRQPAAARDPLRRALDLARACGARPLAERAEHELRASGARPRRDRITGRDALTATEQRVAQLAIDGMTNRQIAEALFVTRKTVKSHLEHIYRKLGIHGRNELHRALAVEDELAAAGLPPRK